MQSQIQDKMKNSDGEELVFVSKAERMEFYYKVRGLILIIHSLIRKTRDPVKLKTLQNRANFLVSWAMERNVPKNYAVLLNNMIDITTSKCPFYSPSGSITYNYVIAYGMRAHVDLDDFLGFRTYAYFLEGLTDKPLEPSDEHMVFAIYRDLSKEKYKPVLPTQVQNTTVTEGLNDLYI